MTQHSDTIRLRHMLDHAQEAVAMVGGKDRADLNRDRVLELALVRNDLPPLIAALEQILQGID